MNDTRENAHGKWVGILKGMGFTDKQLSGEHGPCPMCEGKDRFRFTDYKGNGDYFCSGCGPGSGFDLIIQKHDWEFGYAAKKVDQILGTKNIQEVFKPKVDVEKRRRDLNALWQKGTNIALVESHLRKRGLKYNSMWKDLRGINSMYMAKSNKVHDGMLALVRNSQGIPISVHRTYFVERQRKMMPPTESINGGAIRIGVPAGDTLVIGEGVETTIAGMQHYKCEAGYACISAHGMETVKIPQTIERAIILADHDFSFTGQKAAFTLAHRLVEKIAVTVAMSMTQGDDFNDLVNQLGGQVLEFDNES